MRAKSSHIGDDHGAHPPRVEASLPKRDDMAAAAAMLRALGDLVGCEIARENCQRKRRENGSSPPFFGLFDLGFPVR